MRALIVGLALTALVAGCNQQKQSDAGAGDQNPSGVTLWSQVDSAAINVPDGAEMTLATVNGVEVATITNVATDATSGGRTSGVSIQVPQALETEVSGKHIRVTVRAFADAPGTTLGVAYSTNEVGNSGWQTFPLTTEPADYAFEFDAGILRTGQGDYVTFRDYNGAAVHVVGYKVEVLGPAPTAAPAAPAPATP